MNIQYAKNPAWSDSAHTKIDLTIKWEEINQELPFTANPNDIEKHGRELFDKLKAGEFGAIADYVPPVVISPVSETPEQLPA